jgi:N-acetylglucosamine kinase-like BadF-type ATPase
MRLFLGVDGGQSGTTALIGDETGRVLGEGIAGPCNHAAGPDGRARLEAAARQSVNDACEQAGLEAETTTFESACFGMSGGPDDKKEILAGILKTGRLLVTNDAVIALAGATPSGQGIITIAGTGSICLGRNAAGKMARAGGWGYIFGDEGGAFDITRQALRSILRMEEGWGPPTKLRALLLQATGATSANDLLHRFYTKDWPRPRVARFSIVVDQAAIAGDDVARQILAQAAADLARLAMSVRDRLWPSGEPVLAAYVGGVFHSQTLLERFRAEVEKQRGVRCGPPKYEPAEGALLEAYRASGLNPELSRM